MRHDYDIAIIGAGMVGASFACSLKNTGFKIAVIESVALSADYQPSYDDRGIALSLSSIRILEHIGIWQKLIANATPIKKIHVSERGRFAFTRIDATTANRTELGYVVTAHTLGQVLQQQLASCDDVHLYYAADLKSFARTESGMRLQVMINGKDEVLTTRVLVGADGSNSRVRRLAGIDIKQRDFKQTAIVTNITTQKKHQGTAYERFTPSGLVALLPLSDNNAVLVFIVDKTQADSYLTMPNHDYINAAMARFSRRLGRIEQIGSRRAYPILFQEAQEQYQPNLVLLGNAAHTLHPNAAQGLNLGLRDVAGLADCMQAAWAEGMTLDDIRILERYVSLRATDQQRVIRFTNGLASCFYTRNPLLASARSIAMLTLDLLPTLQTYFTDYAMGISGVQPLHVRSS